MIFETFFHLTPSSSFKSHIATYTVLFSIASFSSFDCCTYVRQNVSHIIVCSIGGKYLLLLSYIPYGDSNPRIPAPASPYLLGLLLVSSPSPTFSLSSILSVRAVVSALCNYASICGSVFPLRCFACHPCDEFIKPLGGICITGSTAGHKNV